MANFQKNKSKIYIYSCCHYQYLHRHAEIRILFFKARSQFREIRLIQNSHSIEIESKGCNEFRQLFIEIQLIWATRSNDHKLPIASGITISRNFASKLVVCLYIEAVR